MDSIANALNIGTVLEDRYTIEAILGEGGFGITYRAHDNKLDCIVVIKEFLPNDFAARGTDSVSVQSRTNRGDDFEYGLKSFLEEARTLAKFQHANIVGVTNFIEANGTAYFVMNYAEGTDLSEWLKVRTEPLDEETILGIIMPILDGLAEVHKTGLMHRDIKPGNIYLRDAGGPMLIDFGAARQALGEHSKSISAIISQGYAPPEQYTTRGKQGPFTDLYAIGATLYRMIVGKAPVESSDRSHAKAEGEADPMTPAIEVGKGRVSDWLLQLTDQLLNISAKDRPQTAESVLEAIKNKTVVDVGSNSFEQKQPEKNNNKTRIVRSSDRFSKSASKSVSGSVSSGEEKKSKTGFIAAAVIALAVIAGGGWWFTQGGSQTDSGTPVAQSKILAKGQSILFVESRPDDAEIYLDNILLGRTPYKNDKLPAGQHELKLVHKDSMDKVETISLNNNEITKKSYELDGALGNISIFSTPSGADIRIGGQMTGMQTPATIKGVKVGEWELELKKDTYYTLKTPVTILKGQTTREDFKLEGGHLVEYNGEWIEPVEKEQRISLAKEETEARAQQKREEEQARALKRKQEEEKKQQLAAQAQQQPVKNNVASAATNSKVVNQISPSGIRIMAPDVAENGAVIPVSLSELRLQPGQSVTLETDTGCSIFKVTNTGNNTVNHFSTRIKLGQSQTVWLRLNDSAIVATKEIKVTLGGISALGADESTRSASWSFIKQAHAAPDLSEVCQLSERIEDFSKVDSDGGRSIKMRAKLSGNSVDIKALMKHPMETGLRKDRDTGKAIPAHYIRGLSVQKGGESIVVQTNAMMSQNPYLSVEFSHARAGETVYLAWQDNRGDGSLASATIK